LLRQVLQDREKGSHIGTQATTISLAHIKPILFPLFLDSFPVREERKVRHREYWSAAERELANAMASPPSGSEAKRSANFYLPLFNHRPAMLSENFAVLVCDKQIRTDQCDSAF
jgi:hypothetical protein